MKKGKIKVAFVYHEVPPFVNAIGSFVLEIAKKLVKKGIESIIITGNYEKDKTVIKEGVKIYYLKTLNIEPRFIWFQIKNKKRILKILKKEEINILHIQNGSAWAFIEDIKKDVKVVLTNHGNSKMNSLEFIKSPLRYKTFGDFKINVMTHLLMNNLEKKELRYASKSVYLTNFIAKSLNYRINKENISIIPQAVDIKKIDRIKKSSEKDYIFLGGRLIYLKGITYVLEAFEEVHKTIPELKLKIFGNGPLKNTIINFAKNNKLKEIIIYSPALPQKELIKEIKGSLFAVMPSLFEAQSILMMEILACKKPIIAFNLPFIKDTLANQKDSLLVKKDSKELAEAIIKLYKDKKLRDKLSKGAYKTAIEKHDWNKIVDKYIVLYEGLR